MHVQTKCICQQSAYTNEAHLSTRLYLSNHPSDKTQQQCTTVLLLQMFVVARVVSTAESVCSREQSRFHGHNKLSPCQWQVPAQTQLPRSGNIRTMVAAAAIPISAIEAGVMSPFAAANLGRRSVWQCKMFVINAKIGFRLRPQPAVTELLKV